MASFIWKSSLQRNAIATLSSKVELPMKLILTQIYLMKNAVFHERSKHITAKLHFIRDL
ncbi:hypothetical protein MA16_Dca003876 [Dendrobium catenatum]|uniref:Retrovirus-related Pol polyprotein from transposon TNT 1-94 n=1 Tax=Dendrobium catenatum TaxID=906689 RepID=A0A2I0X1S8_9ASPA|nr:hypothetical protein MA16_Dca003876 [Dendrobium catenatum]